jgi:addiction module toxin, txe/yoeB family
MEIQEEKNYITTYSEEYLKDIKKFTKGGNKQILSKIADFLKELRKTPKKGTGKPEALKGYGVRDVWSRRINDQHRLVYEIFEEKKEIKILTAFGHYDDK